MPSSNWLSTRLRTLVPSRNGFGVSTGCGNGNALKSEESAEKDQTGLQETLREGIDGAGLELERATVARTIFEWVVNRGAASMTIRTLSKAVCTEEHGERRRQLIPGRHRSRRINGTACV